MKNEDLLPLVMEPLPQVVALQKKLVSQEEELEQLAKDNHILMSSHIRLVESVAAARIEAEKFREHIRNIQTGGDIEVSIILDRYSKIESDIRAGDSLRKDIQEAREEAQSLLTANMKLTVEIEQPTRELDKSHADVENIPRLHVQLDSLRQENMRLRKSFEYEKGLNIESVEQMRRLEKDLVIVAEEVERLRGTLSAAECSAAAAVPYGCPLINQNTHFGPPVQENSCFAESFSGAQVYAVGDQGDDLNQRGPNECATNSLVPVAVAVERVSLTVDKVSDNPASCGSSDMSYG